MRLYLLYAKYNSYEMLRRSEVLRHGYKADQIQMIVIHIFQSNY